MEDQIGIFVSQDGISLEVRISKDTVWLSQEQLARLFERDVSVISRHLGNVFKEGELEREGNLQKMQIYHYLLMLMKERVYLLKVPQLKQTQHNYNLMIMYLI
jgi:hypothetical protein